MKALQEKQQAAAAATLQIHSLAGLGFAMLFGTFALTTQGYELKSAGFIVSIAIAGICIKAICCEYHQKIIDRTAGQYRNDNAYLLNEIAFALAALGCVVIAIQVSSSLFNTVALPNWMGPVPAGLFVGTTLALTISALIATKGKNNTTKLKAAMPFALQMFGASFLVVGAYQVYGLSNILPNSGKPLDYLNISITSFATIAGVAALTTIVFGYKSFVEKNTQVIHDKESENNEDEELLSSRQSLCAGQKL